MVAGSLDIESTFSMQHENGESKIIALSNLITETPSMKLWRADQILTGAGFGLESSVSKEAQEWEIEYGNLCNIPHQDRTKKEQMRLEELSNILDLEILDGHETKTERRAAELIEEVALEKALSGDTLDTALKMFNRINARNKSNKSKGDR